MLKFLRKYNKWILVIGGSLLMVAFLAPQAIQQLPKLRDPKVAEYDGKPVKASEIQLAANELQAINALGGTGNLLQLVMPLTAPTNEQDVEWFLLSREAEDAGFVGSDQDGVTLYPILAQQLATAEVDFRIQQTGMQLSPIERLQVINAQIPQWQERIVNSENTAAGAGRFRTIEETRRAFAKLHGVLRMLQAFERAPRYSSVRATRAASEAFNSATTDYLVISSDRFTDTAAEPTEEELLAHFEEYKDKQPDETDYGIGYLQPQQVKVEWLAIDRTTIENVIEIDPVEASKHQQLNKDQFPGGFSQERPNIEADLKRQKAQRIVEQIENIVQAEMLSVTRTLNRDGEYLQLPEDWSDTHPSLESLAQTIVEKVAQGNDGLTIPAPTVERRDDRWYGQQDIFMFPGVGFSFLQFGSQQIPFYTAVFTTRELNANPGFPIQENLLASQFPFKGRDGNTYFFRVLDSRDISPPDSIEEVREQAVRDMKRLRAYEQLLTELPNYTEVAVNAGLEAVADAVNAGLPEPGEETDENTPPRVNIREGAVIRSRVGQSTPSVFRDEDVLTVAFETSRKLDPTVKIEDVALPDRTYSSEAPKSLAVVVGRISGLQPLTAESFATSYDQVKSTLTQLEVVDLELREFPYSYENLKKRHNFVDTSGRLVEEVAPQTETPDAEDAETSEDN
ncbi:MAG: hypothetical protein Phyf2KO_11960 [Phycisphaerales bacterium]